ncbi:MAG: Na+/H+ antiporter subunit E [Alphaproteobacteria bacterium]|nr:MAG: Na+/H+ antiporter subunit E [Alphaproteobacteria bacterium]
MKLFIVNVLLAIAWVAVTGSFSELDLVVGFVLGMFALWLIREQVGTAGYIDRSRRVVVLALVFLWELTMSAIRVLVMVSAPRLVMRPGIIAYPLKVDRDFEITMLANLITLTPGTLSVDVSHDRRHLFIHTLDASDPDGLKQSIADGFERKIMEAFR